MNAEEFVAAWSREKQDLLAEFTNPAGTSQVAERIRAMQLSDHQGRQLVEIINATLIDTFYTLLLGLDGSAAIGGIQQSYKILGEDGELIAASGDIEAAAYAAFQSGNI